MLKQTPLYPLHLELNAKMVEFADYLMPIQYAKGILHEHQHCRNMAGLFDISHMGQCLVSGDMAATELERLTPSHITGLKPGEQKYTVLTNQDGGVIDDIIITRLDSRLMIIVNAACKTKDFAHLRNQLKNCEFQELPDQALLALQGAAAATVMARFSTAATQLAFMQTCTTNINGIACHISRSGYTGEDGFEISVANEYAETLARWLLAEQEVEPIGLGARDTLRLEAGLCLYGHELNESITPVEAGLRWIIKKDHNQFLGAEKILQQLANGAEKIRVGLLVDSKILVREGSSITDSEDKIIGHVTSGSFSPSLGRPIAMALLEKNAATLGNCVYAKVRNQKLALTVTGLPFVPHRYHR